MIISLRPRFLMVVGGLLFGLGTYYFVWWDIPWLHSGSSSTDEVGVDIRDKALLRPQPSVCSNTSARVTPKNYCMWNTTLQSCRELLLNPLHKLPSWVFLGDADMANIPYFISLAWPYDALNITTYRHSCQNFNYYRLPPPKDGWIAPDLSKGEGPIGRGKQHHYCMDCQRCWNILMNNPHSQENYVEYLVVEYARDVSIQTSVSKTTQETVIYYLSRKLPSVCVASAGMNDAAIEPIISTELYLENVDRYLGLLQRTCENVVWIGMHAVVEHKDVSQTNCRLREWNDAVMELLDSRKYHNVYMVDLWEKSLETDYVDFTHPEKKLYSTLTRLFIALMAGPDIHDDYRHL